MAYEKQTWVDGTTPVDAEHLDHIEDGIAANADDIDTLSADLTDLNTLPIYEFNTTEPIGTQIDALGLNSRTVTFGFIASSSNTDMPNSGGNFFVVILKMNTNLINVFAWAAASQTLFFRYRNGNGWQGWYSLLPTSVSTSSVGDPVVMGDEDSVED